MKRFSHARMGSCVVALLLFAGLSPAARSQDAAPAKSPPAAVRQYADAVALQNRGVYDLAADEWEKFLKSYAKDPLEPKAEYYLGVCRLQLKKYDDLPRRFVANSYREDAR